MTDPAAVDGDDYDRDDEALLAVDWPAVEEEVAESIPADLRNAIERSASATSFVLDKWGYSDLEDAGLYPAVREHSQYILPGYGTVSDRYDGGLGPLSAPIRVAEFDADLRTTEPIEDVADDDLTLVEGVADLLEAAELIDEQRSDWHRSPAVGHGSFGPDALGNCYVTVAHESEEVLRSLDLSGTAVELEQVHYYSDRHRTGDFEEHYEAMFRHERYYSDGDQQNVDDEYTDAAEEIGLLGSNLSAQTSITAELSRREYDYEETAELSVRGTTVTVYEYDKEDATRWVAEWVDRVAIDDVVFTSLVFDEEPDADAVDRAALITEARMEGDA